MDRIGWDEQFPALDDRVYLDSASTGVASQLVVRAVEGFLRLAASPAGSGTEQHLAMDAMRAAVRPALAGLIGAQEEEIALVESTAHGFAIAAQALPLEPGDVVLLSDLEYPQVGLVWSQLPGIKVQTVPHQAGRITPDAVRARLSARTRVLALSSVQWTNGFRADLAAIGELCRERGLWLVVDAIQQLGAIPLDVRQTPVDLLLAGGHKWLNSPFGAGLLYLADHVRDRLRAPVVGLLATDPPEGGWEAFFRSPDNTPVRPLSHSAQARVWEIGGTGNYPGTIALGAAVDLIARVGPAVIADRITTLVDTLIEGLDRLAVTLVTPRNPDTRSGIVTFSVGEPRANTALLEFLRTRGIAASVRYSSGVGGLRVSCHYHNTAEHLDRLLDGVRAWRAAAAVL
jgi:cysteine desulfurase / selenocysteine lyase